VNPFLSLAPKGSEKEKSLGAVALPNLPSNVQKKVIML
jgi:hypothetical protein